MYVRTRTRARKKSTNVSAAHCSWQKEGYVESFAGKAPTLVDSQAVDHSSVHDHENESPRQLGNDLGPPGHGRLGRPKEDLRMRGGETAMRRGGGGCGARAHDQRNLWAQFHAMMMCCLAPSVHTSLRRGVYDYKEETCQISCRRAREQSLTFPCPSFRMKKRKTTATMPMVKVVMFVL